MRKSRNARLALGGILLVIIGAACAPVVNNAVPTPPTQVVVIASDTPMVTASPTVAIPTPTIAAALSTATASLAPTITYTPSPTLGPVEYVIQPGDTLFFIIQQPPWNYRNFNVVNEILRLNPNIASIDNLPPPGTTILIPLPTAAPTDVASTNLAIPQIELPVNTTIIQRQIREGETIIGIAEEFTTTLRILSELNPEVGFFGCDFANPSGGPDCNVQLQVGQPINVPAPTPTPTLSPTPSGSETPTPTPTYAAPIMTFPPIDARINSNVPFYLQWVSVGSLLPDETYLIQIEQIDSQTSQTDVSRATSYLLPESLIPPTGTEYLYRWRVLVAKRGINNIFDPISPITNWQTFTWVGG
jgi:LysM domain